MTKCPRCGSPLEITLSGAEDQPTRSRTLLCVTCIWHKSTWEKNPAYKGVIMEPSKDQKHRQKPYAPLD